MIRISTISINPGKASPAGRIALAGLLVFILFFLTAGCSGKEKIAKQHFDAGRKKIEEGKIEDAAKEFYEYTRLKPKDPEGYAALSQCLIAAGRMDEAYAILEKAGREIPDSPVPNIEMGRFYAAQLMNEKAKEEYDKALKKDPDNPVPASLKGIILVGEGNYDKAYDIFKKIIKIDPKKSKENYEAVTLAYTFLLEIIGRQGRTDKEAFDVITGAIDFMPEYSRGYAVMGIYYWNSGDPEAAAKRLETALKKDAEQEAYANRLLGQIAEKQGNNEKAVQYYDAFLQAYGGDGRDRISDEEVAGIQVYESAIKDPADLKSVRDKVKELKEN